MGLFAAGLYAVKHRLFCSAGGRPQFVRKEKTTKKVKNKETTKLLLMRDAGDENWGMPSVYHLSDLVSQNHGSFSEDFQRVFVLYLLSSFCS